ncbi:hypothetical protein NZK35_17055 [Stieleria sp. ICT_E10.1]|uniref:hypothetical protein n=1 Tax=Stieleria sedimenti TaxID=2976331 RepID=UPI0021801B77|nr:hypothetical protein [Stieleria sedimenti]MCS7468363.1 hypothetical protein [Stieleria sedimenti]
MMVIRLLIVGMLLGGVIARLVMLNHTRQFAPPTAGLDRADLKRVVSRGDIDSQPYCFADDVPILLTAGHDGLPGKADVDDNLDGIVDDRRETGAVGSDDECLGPADEGYQAALDFPGTLSISKGGFVPCEAEANPPRWWTSQWGWFVVGKEVAE